jgi:tRNA threonylcarbamoyladenosine biosynthesis protein TsaE
VDPPTLVLRTAGPDDTRAVAAAVSSVLELGDVIALSGELGAGKTCFVQGAARGLGIPDRVTSPTFVLLRSYLGGRLPVVHCDVYRLSHLRDLDDLGDDVLAPDVVTFVEWGDAVRALLPDDRLDVELLTVGEAAADAPDADPHADRLIRLHARGAWAERGRALTTACATWRDGAA